MIPRRAVTARVRPDRGHHRQSWQVCLSHSRYAATPGTDLLRNFASFSPFGPERGCIAYGNSRRDPHSRIWAPLVGRYVAVEECITVW